MAVFNELKERNRKNLHESEDYIFAKDSFFRESQVATQPEMMSFIKKTVKFKKDPIPLVKAIQNDSIERRNTVNRIQNSLGFSLSMNKIIEK